VRPVAGPGRWIWGLSGLATVAALAIPAFILITFAGTNTDRLAEPAATKTRTFTVPQPVTLLDVRSYGAPVQVTAGSVSRVGVTETIVYSRPKDGLPPAATQSVSGGRLTLADPACPALRCAVVFAVTVPRDVAVTVASSGGPVSVSGVAGADLNSAGGPVQATEVDGPLDVSTGGGALMLDGLTGPLRADTGDGPVMAQGVEAATATVTTQGGEARVGFAAAPDTVVVDTGGGPATLAVPGGPYALTTDSRGGPLDVEIATNSAARRSIAVDSDGGSLIIAPARGPAGAGQFAPASAPGGGSAPG